MPIGTAADPAFLKMPGNMLAGLANMGSLVMPGTPSLPNLPSRASLSPPLSPQAGSSQVCLADAMLNACMTHHTQMSMTRAKCD